jgi:MarR family transcriptional regulator, organic hydroperoxide resistance regulator
MSKTPPKTNALRLENQLCFALYCASRKVVQAYQPHLQQMGITYPQYLVLLALWEEDGLSVKTLGERLLLDSGTLTPLLKRMASAGLLVRAHDEKDERQRCIRLTESGQALQQAALAMRANLQCSFGSQLADGDALRKTLQTLIAAL